MEHKNLTRKEKILDWYLIHKDTINDKSESHNHILDWVFNGYRGTVSAKMEICYELIKLGANLKTINDETFKQIVYHFTSTQEQPGDSNLVLIQILKSDKLFSFKNDFTNFNNTLFNANFSDKNTDNVDLKEKIFYENLPEFKNKTTRNSQHKIGFNAHPLIFLMQCYFFYHPQTLENDLKFFQKIKKFQDYNESLILKNIPFYYLESNRDTKQILDYFKIQDIDSVFDCLDKIKLKFVKISPDKLSESISFFNNILNVDSFRHLTKKLPDINLSNNKKLKI